MFSPDSEKLGAVHLFYMKFLELRRDILLPAHGSKPDCCAWPVDGDYRRRCWAKSVPLGLN